jgi:phage/plasmid-associated DNA primase
MRDHFFLCMACDARNDSVKNVLKIIFGFNTKKMADAAVQKCILEVLPTEKTDYLLQGLFSEYVPPEVIRALRHSQRVPEQTEQDFNNDNDEHDAHKKPRLLLELFASTVNEDGFTSPVLIPPKSVSADRFYGRVYPNKLLSIAGLTRRVRNTLCIPRATIGYCGWYDFDMVNAHPYLIFQICIQHMPRTTDYQQIRNYCENRADIIAKIQQTYGLAEKDLAKDLTIRLFFGGTCQGWFAANRKHFTTDATMADMPAELRLLQDEITSIATWLKGKNPRLWHSVYNSESRKKDTQHKNHLGKFFARFCQSYETMIMSFLIQQIVEQTTCATYQDRIVLSYEYDGVKLLRQPVDTFLAEKGWTLPDLTNWFNQIIEERFHISVRFDVKDMSPIYDIDDFIGREHTIDETPIIRFFEELTNVSAETEVDGFGSHGCIAKFVVNKDHDFVYDETEEVWYFWDRADQSWNAYVKGQTVIPLRRAIAHVDKHLTERRDSLLSLLELPPFSVVRHWEANDWMAKAFHLTANGQHKLNQCFEKIISVQKEVATDGYVNAVVSMCKDYAYAKDVKFNENKELLGFNDGVFDLREGVHRPYTKEDYISFRCGVPFEADDVSMQPRKEKMLQLLKRIFPEDDVREFMMRVYATSLTAYPVEHFFICNGDGRNGKSMLHLILQTLLGSQYALSQLDPKLLTQTLQANSPVPELADLSKKRLVLTKEPSAHAKLQNDTLKTLTGGAKGLRARQLYGKMQDVDMCLTMVMECNKRPKLADEPTVAEQERIFDVEFVSRFTTDPACINEGENIFLADPTLKDDATTKSLAMALFWILAPYAQNFLQSGLHITPVPAKIKERTKGYMKSSFLVLTIFKEVYEDSPNENWTPMNEVLKKLKASEYYHTLEKRDKQLFNEDHLLTSLKVEYAPRIQPVSVGGRNKMCISSVQLRVDPVLEAMGGN